MHFPINIKIGGAEIPSHLIFEILSYFVGYRYYIYLRNKTTDLISTENRIWIFIGAAGGAFLFSRLIGTLEQPLDFFNHNTSFTYYISNKTIVGGLLGGLLGVEVMKRIIGEKNSSGDLFTYPIILALIIGRIGCFLAGVPDHTYGIETALPWGIDFGDGLYRHPTNLYEIVFLVLIWLALWRLEKKYSLINGSRFKLFMVAYLCFRLIIEFIKPDYFFTFGLSVIQLTCLAGLLYYYKVFLFPKQLLNPETLG
jgi:hypothetical protein